MAERRGLTQIVNFPRVTGGFREIPSGGIVDPDFDNVVLLLDFDGVDGATDITDLSASAHVDTFVGDAQVDTDQQYLGVNSALFDGAGAGERIHFPTSADWAMGTGDFTYECGVRFSNNNAQYTFFSNRVSADGAQVRWNNTAAKLEFVQNGAIRKGEAWSPALDTFFHVAVTRQGTNLRMFIDGVEFGTATTFSEDITQGSATFNIGNESPTGGPHNGNIGAVRITKGVARYTANFTPPTEFFPTS